MHIFSTVPIDVRLVRYVALGLTNYPGHVTLPIA